MVDMKEERNNILTNEKTSPSTAAPTVGSNGVTPNGSEPVSVRSMPVADNRSAQGGQSVNSVDIAVHNLSSQISTVQNMPVHNNAWHTAAPHNTPVSNELKRTGLEDLMSVRKHNLPANVAQSASAPPAAPRRVLRAEYSEDGTMRGGYASVKGRVRHSTKLLWIMLVIMTLVCIGAAVCSSLATAFFMRKGAEPVQIISERQQSVAAVVTARESCVAEIRCGGSSGSGVIMKLENSKVYILTNAHVINSYITAGSTPGVRFYREDNYYEAEVVGYNRFYDVAVVTVIHKTLYDTYDLDGSSYFKPNLSYNSGDYVVAIGNGMARGIAAYEGIISRSYELLRYNDKMVPVIRTTAAINAGMSGGALFDLEGHLVGINTYRMSSTDESGTSHKDDVEDTGFVMPISIVYPIYKQILGFGDGREVGLMNMTFYKTSSSAVGATVFADLGFTCEIREDKPTVTSLDANTVRGDIRVGDIIESVGSYTLDSDICHMCGEFLRYRRGAQGTALRLTVNRKGSLITIEYADYGIYVR